MIIQFKVYFLPASLLKRFNTHRSRLLDGEEVKVIQYTRYTNYTPDIYIIYLYAYLQVKKYILKYIQVLSFKKQ